MSISRDIYQFLEGLSSFLVLWIFAMPDDPRLSRNMMYFTEGGAASPARPASRQT